MVILVWKLSQLRLLRLKVLLNCNSMVHDKVEVAWRQFNISYFSLGFHQLNRWFIWSLKLLVKNKEEIWDKKTTHQRFNLGLFAHHCSWNGLISANQTRLENRFFLKTFKSTQHEEVNQTTKSAKVYEHRQNSVKRRENLQTSVGSIGNIRTKFLAPFCSWARVATIEPSLFSLLKN